MNSFSNAVRNQRANLFTFVPLFLFDQFKGFFNLFFLAITVAQLFPLLQVGTRSSAGLIVTYVGPLGLVLFLSLSKEVADEFQRWRKDKMYNSEKFTRLSKRGARFVSSADIRVGDVIRLTRNTRVPADMVLLHTKYVRPQQRPQGHRLPQDRSARR